MGSDRSDPAEHLHGTSDERQLRADALRALVKGTQPEASVAPPKVATVATPLRGTLGNGQRARVWWSAALIGVVIVAVIVATLLRGASKTADTSATGQRSVIQFPLQQIACPESESWSPDGKTLAVVGYVNCGSQGDTLTGDNRVVALFNAATGHLASTFSLQAIITRALPASAQIGDIGAPTWSPDGKLIGATFFYSTASQSGIYGMVALGFKGLTQVIAPTTPVAEAGVTYDHYGTSYIMPPLTVRFDLTTRSASPIALPPAFAYTWTGPSTLNPATLSGQAGASTGALLTSITGSLTYFCSSTAGASYLLSAGGAAWSPDSRYFYSTLGDYGVVSGAQPAGASQQSAAITPACATSRYPAGWQPLAAPLPGLESAERDFQQVDSSNSLMFATSPGASRIAVVESDSTSYGIHGSQTATSIRVYDGATGARQAQLSLQQLITAHHIHQQSFNNSYLQQIAWSPDGRSLALLDNQDLAIIIVGPAELP